MRLLTLPFLFLATAAQAETIYIDCQRYESKCTGDKCFAIAEVLKQDTKKEILAARPMEDTSYEITPTHAKGTFTDFAYVTITDANITLENKDSAGAVKDRVTIDKHNGFYEKYLLHTDGSMKDVPVGQPYNAFFGWCTDKTAPPAATSATPPASQQ